MKNLFLTLILCITINQVQAQKKVNFSGQISNSNSSELIYLGLDEFLLPLKIFEDGTFTIDVAIQQNPSFFYFAKISKRGKIERQTPRIWFENDRINITLDWSNKSFQMEGLMPFQSTSEKIEDLKGKQQIEFILNNPSNIPSSYFVNSLKEKISISELEKFSQSVNDQYKNSIYLKRIENYVFAKKLKTLKKGEKVKDFKLPDKDGNKISVINRRNKKQLIALFSSGCSSSIASINLLEQLAELNNDKIEMTTIWDDKSKNTWLNTHQDKKSKITWTDLLDEYGFASTYLNTTMWPTFYVIDEEGELTEIIKGYRKKTAKKLRALLE
jgi:peroxiredoxin